MGIYSFVRQNKALSLGIAGVTAGILINFVNMFNTAPEVPRDLKRYQEVREEFEGPHLSLKDFVHLDSTYANFATERGKQLEAELADFDSAGFEEVEKSYNESVENHHHSVNARTALGSSIGLISLIPFYAGVKRRYRLNSPR